MIPFRLTCHPTNPAACRFFCCIFATHNRPPPFVAQSLYYNGGMALPPTIQTIVGIVGHSHAMALVRELGGQSFRFPARKQGEKWEILVEIIGPRAAGALVDHFDGEEVYIALCAKAVRDDRHREMIARYDALLTEGHSGRGAVSVLVQEFRPISYRAIEKIVNGPMPGAVSELVTQGALF